MSRVLIGTSGFSYDHWRAVFYPQDLPKTKWLEFYVRHFKTVELNSSFYHLPKRKTFANWRARVGRDFVFSVKGSRFITHVKKLKDCREPLERFFAAANGLFTSGYLPGGVAPAAHLKGVILWQLPPNFNFNLERLKQFLLHLRGEICRHLGGVSRWRCAFEFRNESWLNDDCYRLLKQNKMAVVFQDFAHWPMTEKITADFVYLRLHGKKELYASCYTKKELENWAEKIKNWRKQDFDVYVYFNNDMRGYAVRNAIEIAKLVY